MKLTYFSALESENVILNAKLIIIYNFIEKATVFSLHWL